MRTNVRTFCRICAETLDLPEPIYEFGSFCYKDQYELANIRPFFAGKNFVGCDIRDGLNVDRIENLESLTLKDKSIGTAIVLETMEHVENIQKAFSELGRVVKDGGVLIVASPFMFPIHDLPNDYWRFTPEGLWRLLEGFPKRLCGQQGYRKTPRVVFAVGFKPPLPDDFEARCQKFERTLFERGRRQFNPWRMLRYRLGSLFFGKHPFRDYLHYNDILLKK